jgi:hypothetical protein
LIWSLALACGGKSEEPTEFVAFQSDFADFRSWNRVWVSDEPLGLGHLEGSRYVHFQSLPKDGDPFPVGSILVKTAEVGTETEWDIVAMVKRGDDYNADGAKDWEWFELQISDSGTPLILWRGIEPPAGSGYECSLGGDTGDTAEAFTLGDCNVCHASAWEDDYVRSRATLRGG